MADEFAIVVRAKPRAGPFVKKSCDLPPMGSGNRSQFIAALDYEWQLSVVAVRNRGFVPTIEVGRRGHYAVAGSCKQSAHHQVIVFSNPEALIVA
jgi:hypothetical protein